MTLYNFPYNTLTYSGGWSVQAMNGVVNGIRTSSAGQTISLTSDKADYFLIAKPTSSQARLEIKVDGNVVKTIDLQGFIYSDSQASYVSSAYVSELAPYDQLTVYPLALNLTGTHTILITTVDAVQVDIEGIEAKIGTIALDPTKFLADGDSITMLGGIPLGSDAMPWISGTVYNGYFTQYAINKSLTLDLIGVGGTRLDNGHTHFWAHVKNLTRLPQKVFVAFGMNSYLETPDSTRVTQRYKDYVDIIRSFNPTAQIILSDLTYSSTRSSSLTWWNTIVSAVATAKGTAEAPLGNAYNDSSYLVADGVHPNLTGHTAIAGVVEAMSSFPALSYPIATWNDYVDGTYQTMTLKKYDGSVYREILTKSSKITLL